MEHSNGSGEDLNQATNQTSAVVKLENIVSLADLTTNEQFVEVETDIRNECSKHGTVTQVYVPRPNFLLGTAAELTYSDVTAAYNLNLSAGLAYV